MKTDPKRGKRILQAALRGVSSRDYKEVVAGSAEAAGVSRSTISRQIVEQSAADVESFLDCPLPSGMLAVVIDGIRFAGHMVVGAIGVDEKGQKAFSRAFRGINRECARRKRPAREPQGPWFNGKDQAAQELGKRGRR